MFDFSMVLAVVIGLFSLYAFVHFFIIQFKRAWKDRSGYEKSLTWYTIVYFFIILMNFS